MKQKKLLKRLVTLGIVGMLLLSLVLLCFGYEVEINLRGYAERRQNLYSAAYVMPELDSLPKHEKMVYRYYKERFLFFWSECMLLVVFYDADTYAQEKARMETAYAYLKEPIYIKDEYRYAGWLITAPEFTVKSYQFRVLDTVDWVDPLGYDVGFYPKDFGMIAHSDQKQAIAYLYHYNFDIDVIGESGTAQDMIDFVKDHYAYF